MTIISNHDALVILAREPVPGRVKTRLAKSLGPRAATRLYQAFLLDTLQLAGKIPARLTIWTTGGRLAGFRGMCAPETVWKSQGTGDLGGRLRRAFRDSLQRGARRVVFLGTDSPGLPVSFVRRAFALLRTRDSVVGPAADGGYYLIGLTRKAAPLLERMPWSTSGLLDATLARAQAEDISTALLPLWFDVDEARDLDLLRGLLRSGKIRARNTAAQLSSLD